MGLQCKHLEQQHWRCLTPRLNTYSQFELDLHKLDPELNDACRSITGCLRPTNVNKLYLLMGIAPPDIRRDVCARVKRRNRKQTQPTLYTARFQQRDAGRENISLALYDLLTSLQKVIRCREMQHRQNLAPHNVAVNLNESLAKGYVYQSLGSVEMSQQVTHWCSMQQ